MTQPLGTYLRTRGQTKARHLAQTSRSKVNTALAENLSAFYAEVHRTDEAELDERYRWTSALIDDLKKGEPTARDDKTRKKLSAVVAEVRKILEKAKDTKQLEGRLQGPAYPVLSAAAELPPAGAELALVIAVCQILEVLVRIRRRSVD